MNYATATTGQVRKEIKAINETRTKLVDRIQAAALACIYHAHMHGDVTLAIELAKATGNGMKHEALRLYLSEFGPMVPDKEGVLKYSKSKKVEGDELDAKMREASAVQWHAKPTEKNAEDFSFASLLHALLRKVDNAEGYVPTDDEKAVIEQLRSGAAKIPAPAKKKATA